MAHILELFALAEMTGPYKNFKPHPAMNALAPEPEQPNIKRIIRTYESKPRAEQDMELLSETSGTAYFDIITIPHIES
jgi:hypothetical protein